MAGWPSSSLVSNIDWLFPMYRMGANCGVERLKMKSDRGISAFNHGCMVICGGMSGSGALYGE